jgi:arginase family enzyme
VRSTALVFPFDLFGSGGTGTGARLLGDVVREILDDTARETRPCRADCLRGKVKVKELAFETMTQVADWRKRGRQAARQALKAGDFLLWLGGNHLSVLPVLDELGADDPAGTLVVQFDAHLDVYAFHDTTAELSHGNFLRHAANPLPRLVNLGHRDLFLTPKEIAETFEAAYSAVEIAVDGPLIADAVRRKAKAAARVWIDLDCDALDPAALPVVQQPLPFGLAPAAFLQLLEAAWTGNVVGVSVSEFDPGRDVRETGLNLLGWLVEYVLLKCHNG